MLSSAARRLRLARPHLSSAARYATGAGDAPHSSPAPTSSDEFGPDGYPIGEFDPVLSEINGRYTVKPRPSKAASEVPAASARDEAELSVSEQQEDPASRRKNWQELYGKVGGALDPSKWGSEVAAPPDSMAKAAIESTVSRMAELAEGVSSEEPMGLSLTDEQRIRFDRVTSVRPEVTVAAAAQLTHLNRVGEPQLRTERGKERHLGVTFSVLSRRHGSNNG